MIVDGRHKSKTISLMFVLTLLTSFFLNTLIMPHINVAAAEDYCKNTSRYYDGTTSPDTGRWEYNGKDYG